jgi:hypothetical protein
MKVFNVTCDILQFQVTARSISSAFNRAGRRVGHGRRIVVEDRDKVLSGTIPVEE